MTHSWIKQKSYLLNGEFFKAQEALTEAVHLCEGTENQDIRLCRALFDRSITLGINGFESESLNDVRKLQSTLEKFQCKSQMNFSAEGYYAGGKPILGPDQISVEDCIELTENTVKTIEFIIGAAPVSLNWKASITGALYLAESKAKQCCRAGGIWKACVQPIFHKWMEMKEWERECRHSNHWYLLD